jgi:hypothetical protein
MVLYWWLRQFPVQIDFYLGLILKTVSINIL